MIVIATGFIPLSALSIVSTMGKQSVAWKEYCAEYWLKELQEGMDRCTGHHDIIEILWKRLWISYNQSSTCFRCSEKWDVHCSSLLPQECGTEGYWRRGQAIFCENWRGLFHSERNREIQQVNSSLYSQVLDLHCTSLINCPVLWNYFIHKVLIHLDCQDYSSSPFLKNIFKVLLFRAVFDWSWGLASFMQYFNYNLHFQIKMHSDSKTTWVSVSDVV